MFCEPDVIAQIRRFLPTAPPHVAGRVRDFSTEQLVARLVELGISTPEVGEIAAHWGGFQRDVGWASLLADLVEMVELQRGDFDAPLRIWPDMEKSGPDGRFLLFYLFALCFERTRDFLRRGGCPEEIIDSTFSILKRHAQIHRRKFASTGVDAGWWMIPTLRGEIVHVGSLQFHRVTLGVGSLSPSPWFGEAEAAELGVGFRRGDPSVGIHIPERSDLSPEAVDASLQRARAVIATLWPVGQRRLATCQTWMLDDRLSSYLAETSNIIRFQRRFNLLPRWRDDDQDVLEFVFRQTGKKLSDLEATTTLQRAVKEVLLSGGHWRDRTGWFDFDAGLGPGYIR
jgi:hypothetical protein